MFFYPYSFVFKVLWVPSTSSVMIQFTVKLVVIFRNLFFFSHFPLPPFTVSSTPCPEHHPPSPRIISQQIALICQQSLCYLFAGEGHLQDYMIHGLMHNVYMICVRSNSGSSDYDSCYIFGYIVFVLNRYRMEGLTYKRRWSRVGLM